VLPFLAITYVAAADDLDCHHHHHHHIITIIITIIITMSVITILMVPYAEVYFLSSTGWPSLHS
jgi:hypothetical protein